MKDFIYIKDLTLRCIIGTKKEERRKKQRLRISLKIYTQLKIAAESDSIEDTVDYESLIREIIESVKNSKFNLIEKLAGEIANLCLSKPAISAVEVKVEKPKALKAIKCAIVSLYREK